MKQIIITAFIEIGLLVSLLILTLSGCVNSKPKHWSVGQWYTLYCNNGVEPVTPHKFVAPSLTEAFKYAGKYVTEHQSVCSLESE